MEATIAQAAWGRVFRAAMDAIAGCFARREARATAAEMVTGLLTEVDTRNCWTLAEALGHPGPHRLQHLLSRARFDHDRAQEEIVRLIARELAGQDVVLVADETGDAKSSTDCVGAGRQYSGAIKGVGLCQVAVHLAAVTESVRVGIDGPCISRRTGPRTRNAARWPASRRRSCSRQSCSRPPSWSRTRSSWAFGHAGSPVTRCIRAVNCAGTCGS
ncbi:hypothetical protein E4K10_47025 [Streptomyces sp. T1317-0309]|nr:hypothetical protein E4K10_47025 [Streptomyces sp. T1317-0309]